LREGSRVRLATSITTGDADCGETCDFSPRADRYDRSNTASSWGSYDAYVDTIGDLQTNLAIEDCDDYVFSHEDGTDAFDDAVQNLNVFKPIAGAFGRCTHSDDGSPCDKDLVVELMNNKTGEIVQTAWTDEDGAWATVYKHRGKPTMFTVRIWEEDEDCGSIAQEIELQGNGWANVDFDPSTCTSTAEYGKGRNAR
jgi:hypothetical protein